MINKKVTVEVYDTEDAKFQWRDDWENYNWETSRNDKKITFTKFTNKGKLSKQDDNYSEILAPIAERGFNQMLQLENEVANDQQRANELSEIVNNAHHKHYPFVNDADFESRLSYLSSKTSKSNWVGYELGHARSIYNKMVPTEVINEARELQAIRKKHQNTDDFDFNACNYHYFEIREADHDNYR